MYYKYLNYKEDELENLLESVLNRRTVRFSSPTVLNDPNELKFYFVVDPSKKNINLVRYLADNPNHTEQTYDRWIAALTELSVQHAAWQARAAFVHNYSFLCLSRTGHSNLMWGHYARSHKGICVVYRDALRAYLHTLHPETQSGFVIYREEIPEIRYLELDPAESLARVFLSKQVAWKYEQEYRFVLENDILGGRDVELEKGLVFGVIVGSRMPHDERQKVYAWCERESIKCFEASNMNKSYRLSIRGRQKDVTIMSSFF